MINRESPKGKRASLFATCMVDMLSPFTGMSVVEVLEYLNISIDFPHGQTCCGQPAFNAGYHHEARQVARQFLKTFKSSELIVTPSGSCAAMIRIEYPILFADDPILLAEAKRIASITWEFTEYIVDGLGITNLQGRLPEPKQITFHDSCHGLRLLGLNKAIRILVGNLENSTIIDWDHSETCCGFGGLFSVKMPDVNGAMLQRKLEAIAQSGADIIVTSDISCLTNMNSGLEKQGKQPVVRHIADVLAEGIRNKQ